jgi:hypothetical protein
LAPDGAIFAYWAIVYFGKHKFMATFSHVSSYCSLCNNKLGYTLGDFSQAHLVALLDILK